MIAATCADACGDYPGTYRLDGSVLYGDPNPLETPDHLHDWYDFWDQPLGRPRSGLNRRDDGGFQREFEEGTVVYNEYENRAITVTFDAPRKRVSTGDVGSSFHAARRRRPDFRSRLSQLQRTSPDDSTATEGLRDATARIPIARNRQVRPILRRGIPVASRPARPSITGIRWRVAEDQQVGGIGKTHELRTGAPRGA